MLNDTCEPASWLQVNIAMRIPILPVPGPGGGREAIWICIFFLAEPVPFDAEHPSLLSHLLFAFLYGS